MGIFTLNIIVGGEYARLSASHTLFSRSLAQELKPKFYLLSPFPLSLPRSWRDFSLRLFIRPIVSSR